MSRKPKEEAARILERLGAPQLHRQALKRVKRCDRNAYRELQASLECLTTRISAQTPLNQIFVCDAATQTVRGLWEVPGLVVLMREVRLEELPYALSDVPDWPDKQHLKEAEQMLYFLMQHRPHWAPPVQTLDLTAHLNRCVLVDNTNRLVHILGAGDKLLSRVVGPCINMSMRLRSDVKQVVTCRRQAVEQALALAQHALSLLDEKVCTIEHNPPSFAWMLQSNAPIETGAWEPIKKRRLYDDSQESSVSSPVCTTPTRDVSPESVRDFRERLEWLRGLASAVGSETPC